MKLEPIKADDSTPLEEDWIAAAREMLIEGGVAAVQVNALAGRLGVTRGGFYWRFRNRQDLLDQLLENWRNTNTRAFLMALDRAGTPEERFRRMVRLFIEERTFKPALDAAVRQWAVVDPDVATKVRADDEVRIEAKKQNRDIKDGEIVTACQQACPTQTIVFGNIADKNSSVTQLREDPRAYLLLEELLTRPRTSHLAKLRNPNPDIRGSQTAVVEGA